ncbi:hypothetical protein ADZ36_30375 [Streptomyces fradiae]|uniref:Uncharacterized protein n=2 Tax=Streptomyces TaxID=1883 RepID=A0A3R7I3W0_9ACTN|nr:hypothetical protein ADZ36_30375 [Streptomyces fradiae]OFA47525.1 hypothetical protein BEN35_20490 [Streptomyces fradiae]PQM21806.1 hypothetical protein Sfr7A_19420 [Streptomyces xinghaiensis]RKM93238.1 hypothetical protein SFRA_022310 [Streptomyces xinghaiensis]RNC71164.1 hypothetical protein DC095_023080 [Streptomyces xinghaiensis]
MTPATGSDQPDGTRAALSPRAPFPVAYPAPRTPVRRLPAPEPGRPRRGLDRYGELARRGSRATGCRTRPVIPISRETPADLLTAAGSAPPASWNPLRREPDEGQFPR